MSGNPIEPRRIKVWDLFVRVFHWSLVAAFSIAWLSGDDALALHVWAGYAAGGLVLMRIVWGFVGPKYARFSDFVCGPAKALGYLLRLVAFRAERHIGHSPAAGLMILVLMAGVLVTVWTGLEVYAVKEKAGPLAAIPAIHLVIAPALADDDDEGEGGEGKGGIWGDLHEVAANLMLLLVALHIGGVILSSIAHRENLVRAMVTGTKRAK